MSEIRLHRVIGAKTSEISGKQAPIEKSLQVLMEQNLESLLGVRFVCSEHPTGKVHGGRIDTLGLDETGSPVIIEYKRATNENVINQGLYYLDWLLDHKAEFKLLVMDKLSKQEANDIEWSAPRLICIAGDYTKYDEHAVKQINRNIDLIRYRQFGNDLLALELLYRTSANDLPTSPDKPSGKPTKKVGDKTVSQWLIELDEDRRNLFEGLRSFVLALGDDVSEKQLKLYIAYRRIKNFACIVFQKQSLLVYLRMNPDSISLEKGFSRDVREIGHWATGDLELTIRTLEDATKAEFLIRKCYEES